MDKPEQQSPWNFEWSRESIRNFWNLFAHSPLTRLSFSKLVAPSLVDLVSAQVSREKRILDFGAGNGDFCRAMMQAGYKVAVYEPSEERRHSSLSLSLSPNFLGAVSSGRFECVTCFEVLEHIFPDDLENTMRLLGSFLEPGGMIIGTVPRDENLEEAQCICPHCGALFHRWQHMRSFNAQSLAQFLQSFGFNVKAVWAANFAASLIFVGTKD